MQNTAVASLRMQASQASTRVAVRDVAGNRIVYAQVRAALATARSEAELSATSLRGADLLNRVGSAVLKSVRRVRLGKMLISHAQENIVKENIAEAMRHALEESKRSGEPAMASAAFEALLAELHDMRDFFTQAEDHNELVQELCNARTAFAAIDAREREIDEYRSRLKELLASSEQNTKELDAVLAQTMALVDSLRESDWVFSNVFSSWAPLEGLEDQLAEALRATGHIGADDTVDGFTLAAMCSRFRKSVHANIQRTTVESEVSEAARISQSEMLMCRVARLTRLFRQSVHDSLAPRHSRKSISPDHTAPDEELDDE